MISEQIEKLKKQLDAIEELYAEKEMARSAKFVLWHEATIRRVKGIFGEDSEQFTKFSSINFLPSVSGLEKKYQRQKDSKAFNEGLHSARTRLFVMIDELNEKMQGGASIETIQESKNKKQSPPGKLPKRRLPVQVIVALIGVFGLVIPAVFSYLSEQANIKVPISATQTAEARLTENFPTQTPTNPTQTPYSG